jgi:CheY-like chemotaxis protein
MNQPPLLLVVDDEPSFREIFSLKLGNAGFHVETAENGSQGIEKAKALKPDLILMDVQMPGLNGVETMMELKEDGDLKHIPLFFLTNLGDAKTETQRLNDKFSQEVGAAGYLKKTDDLDTLVMKVKAFLAV